MFRAASVVRFSYFFVDRRFLLILNVQANSSGMAGKNNVGILFSFFWYAAS